jgi:hypothetical protein
VSDSTTEHTRVLTITVRLEVPQGLKRNIRLQRINEVIDKFEALLRGYVPGVFPWAESMEVSATWDYRQFETHRQSALPSTIENTASS